MENKNKDSANNTPVKNADKTNENLDKKSENYSQQTDTKKIDSSDGEPKRITRKKDPIDY
jgi:hypothetical protein